MTRPSIFEKWSLGLELALFSPRSLSETIVSISHSLATMLSGVGVKTGGLR